MQAQTTAGQLLALRDELIVGGVPPETADVVLIDAAKISISNYGLRVADPDIVPSGRT